MQRLPLGQLFAEDDSQAHCFRIRVTDGGEPCGLDGMSIYGYFLRADEETVMFSGSVENSEAVITLPAACYVSEGAFSLIVKAEGTEGSTAILWASGRITRSLTDTVVDPESLVPSLSGLLSQIERIESAVTKAETCESQSAAAVTAAQTAVAGANAAAEKANQAADAWSAAASNASQAADRADASAQAASGAAEEARTAAASADTAAQGVETVKSGAEQAAADASNAAQEARDAAALAAQGPFRYLGSAEGTENFPGEGNSIGDVRSDSLTGICWVWDGTAWITLAENITFSGRVTSVNGKTGEVEVGFGGNDLVKLWTNSGGDSDVFTPQSVSVIPEDEDPDDYTGFIFCFRERPANYNQLNEVTCFTQFVPYETAFTGGSYNRLEHYSRVIGGVVSREYSFSLPAINFGEGTLDGTTANYYCVPTAVYGIRNAGENIVTMGDFYGATAERAGAHGLVPAPAAADRQKYLRGDGSWGLPALSGLSTVYKHAELTEAMALPATTMTEVLSLTLEPGYLWLVCGNLSARPDTAAENDLYVFLLENGTEYARQSAYNDSTHYHSASLALIVSTLERTADMTVTLAANPRTQYTTQRGSSANHAAISAVRLASAAEE